MSGQVLERFRGKTVEFETSLDWWYDTHLTATLADFDRDFITFQFSDGELIAIKKSRVLWVSDQIDRGGDPEPQPEPEPAKLDMEVWNVCNVE